MSVSLEKMSPLLRGAGALAAFSACRALRSVRAALSAAYGMHASRSLILDLARSSSASVRAPPALPLARGERAPAAHTQRTTMWRFVLAGRRAP